MSGHRRGLYHVLICAIGLGIVGASRARAGEDARDSEESITCQLLYESADGIYVSAGSNSRLQKGDVGRLERGGLTGLRVEVVSVSKDSALLRLLGPRPAGLPAPGDSLTLVFGRGARAEEPRARSPSPTLKDREAGDEPPVPLDPADINAPTIPDGSKPGQLPDPGEGTAPPAADGQASPPGVQPGATRPLVPLLAGEKTEIGAFTDAFNISQGQISVRQLFQFTPGKDLDYSKTQVRSSGSLERINSTPWAFEWSGDLSYRDGEALENVQDFRELRLELYRLAFYRRFDDQSTVRLGRFLPRELPSVGYLDGAQGEWVLNESLRLGGMFGFKPRRVGLDFSVHEPTQVAYATLDVGDRGGVSYNGTLGVLTSLYKGNFDRLAVLAEQTLRVDKLTLLSSSELDFDAGGAETRRGTRLTRLDLAATYPVVSHTTLRAGLDRFERPDTAAERDAVPALVLEDDEFFDRGYTRYWVGASHELPWKLRLSEELSVMDAVEDDWSVRWHLSLTRSGIPLLPPSSSLTLTVFNLLGEDLDGYGGRLSGHIPLQGHRLSLQPEVAFRFLQSDLHGGHDFFFTDVALRAFWTFNRHWSLSGGAAYAFSDNVDVQRVLLDLGVTFRW